MSNSLAAVIFDLDGTLLDSLEDIATTANLVLAERHFPVHPVDRYRMFVGDGVSMLFERALPPSDERGLWVPSCVARFQELYESNWNVRTRPYAGIVELIVGLRRRGVPLAVLSNKPHLFTVKCVNEFFDGDDFEVVLGQREGVPRKPDPAGAVEIASRLEVLADHCLYLGDSCVDMQTAVRAGMYPVGALWGFRERAELEASGAACVMAAPLELLEFWDRK